MSREERSVRVLVEIPKGSRNKYEYDQETGDLELGRRLFAAVSYPVEYGFVKDTIAHSDPSWESLREIDDLPGDLAGTRDDAAREIERARERFRGES